MTFSALMLGTWLVVASVAVGLFLYSVVGKGRVFAGLIAASVWLAAVGLVGLLVGLALHPNSNRLGGFGPVFGPIWWIGGPLAALVLLSWLASRLFAKPRA